MLRNKSVLEVKVNERNYQVECYPEASLGEVYDALMVMANHVVEIMRSQSKKECCNEE